MVVMGFVLNLMIKEAFWFGGCRRQRERERERESKRHNLLYLFIYFSNKVFIYFEKEGRQSICIAK